MEPSVDTGFILKVKPNIKNVKYFKLNIDKDKPNKLDKIQTICGWVNNCLVDTITYDIVIDGINIFKGKEFMSNIIGNGKNGTKLGRYKFELFDIQQPEFPNGKMSADTSIKNSEFFIERILSFLYKHDKDYTNKDIVMVLPFHLPMTTIDDIIVYNLFVSSIKNKIVIPLNSMLNKKFDVLIPFIKDVPEIDTEENMINSVNDKWEQSMIITEIDNKSGSNSLCMTKFNEKKNHNNCELDDILCLLLSKKSKAVVTNDRDLLNSSIGYNFSSKKRHMKEFIEKWGNSIPCVLIDNEVVSKNESKTKLERANSVSRSRSRSKSVSINKSKSVSRNKSKSVSRSKSKSGSESGSRSKSKSESESESESKSKSGSGSGGGGGDENLLKTKKNKKNKTKKSGKKR